MNEINKEKYQLSIDKKINIKLSNMNMKIIINENNRRKNKNSFLLDKSNFNKFILPSFTKKYLILYLPKMKKIAIIGAGISGLFFANLIEKINLIHIKYLNEKIQLISMMDMEYNCLLIVLNYLIILVLINLIITQLYFPKKVNF